jgi:hypothetical protein
MVCLITPSSFSPLIGRRGALSVPPGRPNALSSGFIARIELRGIFSV